MEPMPQTTSWKTKVTQERWFANLPWIDQENPDIEAYCQSNAVAEFDLCEKLQQWHRDGIVIFENAINTSEIDGFLAELDELISENTKFELEIDFSGSRKPISQFLSSELRNYDKLRFNNIHCISPAARKLALSQSVVSFLKHIFQDQPCAMQTLCFNKGSQQPVHADFAFVHNQTDISFMAASWMCNGSSGIFIEGVCRLRPCGLE
jgi:hypothetical protein